MSDILTDKLSINIDTNNGGFDYCGYMDKRGNWVISKSTTSTGATTLYKVGVGTANYVTAWTQRTSLTYGYPTIS